MKAPVTGSSRSSARITAACAMERRQQSVPRRSVRCHALSLLPCRRALGERHGSRATPKCGRETRCRLAAGELGRQAGRDDHGVDYVDHTVRRQDVGGDDGGAAVEGQLSVLQRERDRLALEGLDGAELLCDGDRLSALDVAGDDVVVSTFASSAGRRGRPRRLQAPLRERERPLVGAKTVNGPGAGSPRRGPPSGRARRASRVRVADAI
jgi:hypothetical protein